ncbi:MAG: cell division protein FtsH [Dehalococcoidales bacterium]|nr:cell division protein FtsH [Dehalococcoidales bacterium]
MYTTHQLSQSAPVAPMQVSGPSAYLPMQTDWSAMLSSFMPMIMLVLMMAMVMPMMKSVASSARD